MKMITEFITMEAGIPSICVMRDVCLRDVFLPCARWQVLLLLPTMPDMF